MHLKQIREEIGFSYGDMALILGLRKSIYQGYETGRRAIPHQVQLAAEEALVRDREYWRTLPDRIDARIARESPDGIRSEVTG